MGSPRGRYPRAVVSVQGTRPRQPRLTPVSAAASWLAARTGVRLLGADPAGTVLSGVALNTARVLAGDLYAALPGARAHGADFVAAALAGGAVAVLTDPAGAERLDRPEVPVLVVERPRFLLGRLSAWLYGDPAASLRTVGVTGTHGKTTTTRLAEAALQQAGHSAAVVGTVGTRVAGEDLATSLTTPEAPDLHGLFALMRERGVEACALEVSSHALVLGRVDGVVFDVAAFTNLGRDHLDFHRDEEEYFAAKASLFTPERSRRAVVCIDDPWGRRLADLASIEVRTLSVRDQGADWHVADVESGPSGSTFTARGPEGVQVRSAVALPGEFNVTNALTALAACAEAGFAADRVAGGLARAGGVPGRLEPVAAGQDFLLVVDYAHKPDAVAAALRTLRPLARRLIVVLGAGGDRDPGKRPLMGAVAGRGADVLLVTDDNPRTEDPAAIRRAVLAGAERTGAEVLEVGDRREAIRTAVGMARKGDVVLVAGKGHEGGQEVAGVVSPFDDRVVAAELVRERLAAGDLAGSAATRLPEPPRQGGPA